MRPSYATVSLRQVHGLLASPRLGAVRVRIVLHVADLLQAGPRDRAEEARLAFGGSLERLSRDRRLVAACLVVEDRGRLEREAPVELGRLRAKRRPERFEDLELDLVRAHLRVDDLDARRFIVPYGDAVDLERAAGHLRAHELAPMHLRREEVEVLGDVELGDFPLAVLEDLELSRVGSEIERDLESSTSAPPTVCLHGTGGCASCRDGK